MKMLVYNSLIIVLKWNLKRFDNGWNFNQTRKTFLTENCDKKKKKNARSIAYTRRLNNTGRATSAGIRLENKQKINEKKRCENTRKTGIIFGHRTVVMAYNIAAEDNCYVIAIFFFLLFCYPRINTERFTVGNIMELFACFDIRWIRSAHVRSCRRYAPQIEYYTTRCDTTGYIHT